MKGVDSNPSSGSRHEWLSKALVARQLFRGLTAFALGLALLINPSKTESLLLTFMGFFWFFSGITLFFRPETELGRRMSWAVGLVGTVTGLIVISRSVIGAWLTDDMLFELLGTVILVTGISHMLYGLKIYFRTPPRQIAYHFLVAVFLLGVFELILGAMMFVSAFERGPHMYWMAAIWSLIGGALIFSQALYPRSEINLR
jgi:uncharacterized membrane protein HdeD (DUF308 family)